MPVYQELVNFDEVFHQLSDPPIIINDLMNSTEDDRENVRQMVTTRYTGDMISLLPSCRCGAEKGEHAVGKVICGICNTPVQSAIDTDVEPSVWFRKPIGVEQLINPIALTMLKNRFKRSGYNLIQWFMDRTYRPNVRQPPIIDQLIESGIPRGYNSFVQNFDQILELLFGLKDFRLKGGRKDYLLEFMKKYRGNLFSDFLPLVNKSLLIIEKTSVGIYIDNMVLDAVDMIEMLVSIDKNFYDQSPAVKENRTAKGLVKLSDYYETYFKLNLAKKQGQFRRHAYGSRTDLSFRSVISSITDTHEYDEIHVPWMCGLVTFRPDLLNKLMNKSGMDRNSAIGLLLGHTYKYHPLIDKYLQELVSEASGGQGIRVLLNRFPALLQGSIINVRITRFKTDPKDMTIGLGILAVVSLNADKAALDADTCM